MRSSSSPLTLCASPEETRGRGDDTFHARREWVPPREALVPTRFETMEGVHEMSHRGKLVARILLPVIAVSLLAGCIQAPGGIAPSNLH